LLRCLNQSKAAIKAAAANIPTPVRMPICAPFDSPWGVVVAAAGAAVDALIAMFVSAVEWNGVVFEVVERRTIALMRALGIPNGRNELF